MKDSGTTAQTGKTFEESRETLSVDYLEDLVSKVKKAQKFYSHFPQTKVDRIFKAAAQAANEARIPLAKMAAEETGMGVAEDKVIKNHFASESIYNKFKDEKTCGEISRDDALGVTTVAEPLGIIAGVIPTTNPTSTTIFKALMALKTRNGIIFSPHPRAKKCTVEAARIVLDAAVKAGAPENIIGWIEEPSIDLTQGLMGHSDISTILATGGPGMVKAAYQSGKPALGVGAGNTPAIIDETADIKTAVSSVLMSKTFDNGMICASEQTLIVVDKVYDAVKAELTRQGAVILSASEQKKVGTTVIKEGRLNAAIVGQKAAKIAELAGVTVDPAAKVLVGEAEIIGREEPFSFEKLSPVLGLYKAENFESALQKACKLLRFGGMGHTSVLHTNPAGEERIAAFSDAMKSGRTLINMPASQGAIGDIFNFGMNPSLTLGCGSWGGNSISENVSPKHLLNYKTIASRRENMLWFQVPQKIYFKKGALSVAMNDLKGKKKAFIVTDGFLAQSGMLAPLTNKLDELGILWQVFSEVKPDPTLAAAKAGVERMNAFQPDTIIALGGGSPMDAAKIMWVLYEHPEVDFQDLAMRFMDIRKRIYTFPTLGEKAIMVAIPTTSGTGSEVTPFAVITDEATGMKYPIADYQLTPNMAIVDTDLVKTMPPRLTAYSGVDALTHALEAIVSTLATEYTTPMALEAIRLLMEYLPRAYKDGNDEVAREKVHHAANLAGMAFANAFLGVCHSMAHKLGAYHHLPHGLANALLINEVIRYNAEEAPTKQGIFPQYRFHEAKERYARVASYLNLAGSTDDEKVESLIAAIDNLKRELKIPASIKEAGVEEAEFMKSLEAMTEDAFDDQCTGANPRYPLMEEIKSMYLTAYGK